MRLRPYPRCKPSGIDWLGDVPAHWRVAKIRRFAEMKTGHTPSRQHPEYWDECTIPWFTLADVWQLREGHDFLCTTEEKISEVGLAHSAAELLPEDTVVLSRTASVGFAGIMPEPMATSQDYWNWICGDELLPKYLLFVFRAMKDDFKRLTMGSTHPTIYQADAAALTSCIPLLSEQQVIAEFLDSASVKFEALIKKNERLRTLLIDRWRATLDRQVLGFNTGGARAKVVGHPYVQDLPAGWSFSPLKYLVDERRPIMYGIVLPGPDVDDGVSIVKGGDVRPGRLSPALLAKTTREIEAGYARSRLKHGDLVISIRGSIGEVEIVPSEIAGANLTQDAARIAPRRGVSNRWLRYALRAPSIFAPLAAKTTGATIRGINIFDLDRVLIPVPPHIEQLQIAARLANAERQMDRLQEMISQHSALIHEHRTALITAAVTGKIDLREAASAGEPAALAVAE